MTIDQEYPKAVPFVSELIRGLCPAAEVTCYLDPDRGNVVARVTFQVLEESERITFDLGFMDDLEAALSQEKASSHDEWLKQAACSRIYVTLGKAGFIPDFRVSNEIINEKSPFRETSSVRTDFDERMTEVLAKGLQRIRTFLSNIVHGNKDLEKGLEPLAQALEEVNDLLAYHEKHGHLNLNTQRMAVG